MNCKICGANSKFFANAELLRKYAVSYFICENCGFVQTEEPYWLSEAYSQPINRNDVGIVDRNIRLAKISKAIISILFNPQSKFIDYGGGFGLFVRLMRDAGFDFYHHDKYCENIFAQDFEAEPDKDSYELLTAFEVFEHLANPLEGIEQMLAFSKNILFTTEILPSNNPKPGEWWYYIPEYGQHISFYTIESLSVIARKFSMKLYTNGSSLHLLTGNNFSPLIFKLLFRHRVVAFLNLVLSRESLIPADFRKITGKYLP